MSNTATTATASTYYVEALCDAGFAPTDGGEEGDNMPAWLTDRYEAVIFTRTGPLVAGYTEDTLLLQALTPNGVINEEVRFPAPDGEMTARATAAFIAAASAWAAM